ncbi:MAG: hypothetical protein AAGA59_02050 [Actinomycetota bacterium]
MDVKLADAVEAVGLTTGSAYKIWQSQDEFQRDVALHLAATFDWARISAVLPSLTGDPESWNAWSVANEYFVKFTESTDFFVALQLWGVMDASEELTDSIRSGYAEVTADTKQIVELYLKLNDRTIRSPFTLTDASVALTIATEGAAIRHRFDPEALVSSEPKSFSRYVDVVKAILLFYTEPLDSVEATSQA